MAWYIKLNYWGYPQICAICQGLFSIPSTSDVILYILQFTTSSSTALILFVTFLIHSMKSSSKNLILWKDVVAARSQHNFFFLSIHGSKVFSHKTRATDKSMKKRKKRVFPNPFKRFVAKLSKLQQNIKNPRIAHEFFVCLL